MKVEFVTTEECVEYRSKDMNIALMKESCMITSHYSYSFHQIWYFGYISKEG
jgi:hypothetical protein